MNDWAGFNKILRFDKNVLAVFTAEQGKPILDDTELVLAFVPLKNRRALLSGAFWNKGPCEVSKFRNLPGYSTYSDYRVKDLKKTAHSEAKHLYNLTACEDLAELYDRLIIDWGGSTISWHQKKIDKSIDQILPTGFVSYFPGWDKVKVDYEELNAIMQNPEGNSDWFEFLNNHVGVYLILDTTSGQQYIGSATGEAGFWGRWLGYAGENAPGHNGNQGLIELLDLKSLAHKKNFRYSLHHVFSKGSVTENTVLEYESLLKEKMGSRVTGLNHN